MLVRTALDSAATPTPDSQDARASSKPHKDVLGSLKCRQLHLARVGLSYCVREGEVLDNRFLTERRKVTKHIETCQDHVMWVYFAALWGPQVDIRDFPLRKEGRSGVFASLDGKELTFSLQTWGVAIFSLGPNFP